MFYEPQTLIVVYKDEMLANQIKKLIETKDDAEGTVTSTRDNSINAVTWTEKVWLTNKSKNISSTTHTAYSQYWSRLLRDD